MKQFLTPNIDRRGRIARAIYGAVLLIVGGVAVFYVWWAGALLIVAGAFGLYEAKRGWCLMRACGIKTRL
jgi:hypothetical protein